MSTQADWHLADLEIDEDDPFSGALPIEQVGTPIDLTQDTPTLSRQLVSLVEKEGRLGEAGIVCAIKERPDTCCSACPLAQQEGELGALCAVGMEQERLITAMAVERTEHGESGMADLRQ